MSTTLIGNVVRDPEIKFTQNGTAVCNFSIAVKKKRGEETYTSFFDCTAFGSMAENVANSIHKGDRVILTGELNQRSYEDKEGNKRSAIEINVEGVGHDLRWQSTTAIKNES